MAAGFKVDVEIGAPGAGARLLQRFNFCVVCPRTPMGSTSHNFSIADDYTSHPGIGIGQGVRLSRKAQRPTHKIFVRGAGWLCHVASLHFAEEVSQLVFFYFEVSPVAHVGMRFQGNSF